MAFGRKKKEDPFLEKEREMLSENENYSTTEIDMRSTYIIKILVPIDKYGNDYKAFFITENERFLRLWENPCAHISPFSFCIFLL